MTGTEPRQATLADFADSGRGDGKFLSDVFAKLIEPHGDSIPVLLGETFTTWRQQEVAKCEARFRLAGCSEIEISTYRLALLAELIETFTKRSREASL